MSETAESAPGEGRVHVVGTAHVSAESVEAVEEAIETERPDVVAVELDEGRYRQMKGETPDDIEPGDLLEGNTVFQFLAYWMLSYVQTRLGERFDVQPGADMLAGVETAERLGIDVALVDRDIQTTIQRFWARMSLLEKLQMVGGLAFGVSDPRIVGVVVAAAVGLFLGPVVGLFHGTLGVSAALLERIAAGALLAAVAGYALSVPGRRALGEVDGLFAGLAGGVAVGSVAATLGVGAGLVSGFLGTAVGSLAIGLTVGLLVGGVAAAVVGAGGGGSEEDLGDLDAAELTDADVVSVMMDEFRQFSPGGASALIDERDAYIAHRLVALRERGHRVVAVVGAGHREGIERYLANPETLPPMESLVGADDGGGVPWLKLVGGAVSLGFLAFFALLAMAGVRNEFLLRLFGAWFLINAAFAAGLAKLAGARWSSAGVGGAVAWMTSINPLIAPGWFAGYMELRRAPVNVSDIGRLNELLADEEKPLSDLVAEMLDVPLFRLIAVVALTNVGSMVASALFLWFVLPAFFADLGVTEVGQVTDLMLRGARRSAETIWRAVA